MLPGVKLAGWLIGTSAELEELSVYEMHSETPLGAVVLREAELSGYEMHSETPLGAVVLREAECSLQTLSVLRLIV